MKIVYVISPLYLKAIMEESKQYSFTIRGYGNLQNAIKELKFVNTYDILGFVYLSDSLPKQKDLLIKFLQKCNLFGRPNNKKLFIFAIKETNKLSSIVKNLKTSNLEIRYVNNMEFISDKLIKQQIFGDILLYNYQPYELTPIISDVELIRNDISYFSPIIPENILDLAKPIIISNKSGISKEKILKETLQTDLIYNKYLANKDITILDKVLLQFRYTCIKKKCNIEYIQDYHILQNLIKQLKDIVDFSLLSALAEKLINKQEISLLKDIEIDKIYQDSLKYINTKYDDNNSETNIN